MYTFKFQCIIKARLYHCQLYIGSYRELITNVDYYHYYCRLAIYCLLNFFFFFYLSITNLRQVETLKDLIIPEILPRIYEQKLEKF